MGNPFATCEGCYFLVSNTQVSCSCNIDPNFCSGPHIKEENITEKKKTTKESVKKHIEYLRGVPFNGIIVETIELGKCADCGEDTHFLVLEKRKSVINKEHDSFLDSWEHAYYVCDYCDIGG